MAIPQGAIPATSSGYHIEGGMALYSNKGELITTYAMPTADGGDGYGYEIAINPQKNVLLTSSFTGWNNYMTELGKVVANPEAMKRFGP